MFSIAEKSLYSEEKTFLQRVHHVCTGYKEELKGRLIHIEALDHMTFFRGGKHISAEKSFLQGVKTFLHGGKLISAEKTFIPQ